MYDDLASSRKIAYPEKNVKFKMTIVSIIQPVMSVVKK
jgi:hypothetical protein